MKKGLGEKIRALFAKGALLAAKFLTKSKAGLYGMQSLIS